MTESEGKCEANVERKRCSSMVVQKLEFSENLNDRWI